MLKELLSRKFEVKKLIQSQFGHRQIPLESMSCNKNSFFDHSVTIVSDKPVLNLHDFFLVYQSLIRSTPTPEQEVSQTRPIPLNPALYGTVCNSLPSSIPPKSSASKNELGRQKPDSPNEAHQLVSQLRRCKIIDRDTALVVNNEDEDGMNAFPHLPKKSVEFASEGDEECLLVLAADKEPHDAEGLEDDDKKFQQQQQRQTGVFCHFPSSFV
ncbi:unnamed protein product [Rodentolepis nana]|uniref:NET domain-containing protein n=1 Tax=Rodentolepis nana TaxID=102285 RepID=A0A0R3U083_RODNA|nr:unnamed protein product [Rodentolepis nana]